jgi:hypothetical protein
MPGKRKTFGKGSKKRPKLKKKKSSRKPWLWVAPEPSYPDVEFMDYPSLGEIRPPAGFRVVSYSQAMMEYAGPILEVSESRDVEEINDRMQIASRLWNYGIAAELITGPRPSEKEIITSIENTLKMRAQEATDFFHKMIERKSYLFTDELQQNGVPFMLMRKELSHLITPFDQHRINLSEEPILPDEYDRKFIDDIKKLDSFIHRRADYGEYRTLFTSFQERCTEVFGRWLIAKGSKEEFVEEFVWFPEIFCDFVYGYFHEDVFVLKSIPREYLAMFFSDFALRKAVIEPHEYTYIPASIKLFYRFLFEKKYLDNPEPFVTAIDKIEPYFMEILRKRFG